jgi:3-dehydroquinate synthase
MSHIFLYGPSGTGKSTIGKLLAQNLKLPFIDLDRVIETKTDMSIPQIMKEQGEPAFRDLESIALKNLASEKESVIALGGGALLRDENRAFAESHGKVLLLMADLETLVQRLHTDAEKRPLLAGDLRQKLTVLLAKRNGHYSSFPLYMNVDAKTVEQNVKDVQIALGQYHLSAMGEYDVIVQEKGVKCLGEMLQSRGLQNPIVVTDDIIASFHLEKILASLQTSGFEPTSIVLPAGEEHKNLETVSRLWRSFLENKLDRKSTVIALGGGVIGDMAGFAASTYMRGVNWVGIPTTLLSMVDASLGGKTGFDLPEGKNLIGSFHSPKLVLADPQLLQTLPEREIRSGMAEVVKHGIISDPELFALCSRGLDWVKLHLEEIVKRAMAVKIKIIEEDPYEKGFRAALNLGHTIGHAVELVSKFELRHGEAIAIGMVIEAKYAERIGLAEKGLSTVILKVLNELRLPVQIPKALSREEIIRAMRVDKKKDSQVIRFALPIEIGKVELVKVADLDGVLEEQ